MIEILPFSAKISKLSNPEPKCLIVGENLEFEVFASESPIIANPEFRIF